MQNQLPNSQSILNNYQEISKIDIRWIYDVDYYDGPLSGMIEYNKKNYWTEAIHLVKSYTGTNLYVVLELTQEQYDHQEYWNELFELCVGTHCRYDINGKRNALNTYGNKAMQQFYYTRSSEEKQKLDFSQTKIIGWFSQ